MIVHVLWRSVHIVFLSSVQSHVTASRRALVDFLARYPLCYGYWKKFVDLERRAGHIDKAEEVINNNSTKGY